MFNVHHHLFLFCIYLKRGLLYLWSSTWFLWMFKNILFGLRRGECKEKVFNLLSCKYFVRGHNHKFYVCTIMIIMNSLFVSFNTRQTSLIKESALLQKSCLVNKVNRTYIMISQMPAWLFNCVWLTLAIKPHKTYFSWSFNTNWF